MPFVDPVMTTLYGALIGPISLVRTRALQSRRWDEDRACLAANSRRSERDDEITVAILVVASAVQVGYHERGRYTGEPLKRAGNFVSQALRMRERNIVCTESIQMSVVPPC
jgi:hypothetical protein